jgi:hypothetical protein
VTELLTIKDATVICEIRDDGQLFVEVIATTLDNSPSTNFILQNGKVVIGKIPWKSMGN